MSCTVCNSTERLRLYRPRAAPGPVVRCRSCGLIYIWPIEDGHAVIDGGPVLKQDRPWLLTSADLADLEGSWELALLPPKEREAPALRQNAADALARIEQYVRPPGRLLDFGCGWGFALGVARDRGWKPFGVEPLPGHAVYARATWHATVITDILREDTFPAEMFDVITAFQVFEHLPDPADVLTKLIPLLRPGGIMLIEVPNIDTWSVRLLRKHHRHYVQDHLTFFSQATLGHLLKNHGLEIITTYYPRRRMTLRHLLVDWGSRLVPGPLIRPIKRVDSPLLNHIIALNIGDILAIIARKPNR